MKKQYDKSFINSVFDNDINLNNSSKASIRKPRNFTTINVIIIAVIVAFAVFLIIDTCKMVNVVSNYSSTAQAIVTGKEYDHTYTSRSKRGRKKTSTKYYRIIVKYEYNGKLYELTPQNGVKSESGVPSVGSEITVRFDPSNPSKSYITKGKDVDSKKLNMLISSSAMIIIAVLLAIFKSVYDYQTQCSNRLLIFFGKIPQGVILFTAIASFILFMCSKLQ